MYPQPRPESCSLPASSSPRWPPPCQVTPLPLWVHLQPRRRRDYLWIVAEALSARLLLAARSGSNTWPARTMPAPSPKEGCANRAPIDLLIANTRPRVLADVSLTIGWKQPSRCYVNLASARHDLRRLPAASFAAGLSPHQRRRRDCCFSWPAAQNRSDRPGRPGRRRGRLFVVAAL